MPDNRIARIYRRHRRLFFTVAYALLSRESEAEDAVQDGFLKLTQHRERYEGLTEEQLRALAVVMVKHAALDILRREKRLMQTDTEPVQTPEDGLTLTDAIRALGPEDRQVLELRFVLGLTGSETAARLGITEDAVHTRVSRARKRLKKLLREEENP